MLKYVVVLLVFLAGCTHTHPQHKYLHDHGWHDHTAIRHQIYKEIDENRSVGRLRHARNSKRIEALEEKQKK